MSTPSVFSPQRPPLGPVLWLRLDARAALITTADELFGSLAAIPKVRSAAVNGGEVSRSLVLPGLEVAFAGATDERKVRAAWKRHHGGGAMPLLLVTNDASDPSTLRAVGLSDADGPFYAVKADALYGVLREAVEMPSALRAVRHVGAELERIDRSGVAGLRVRGLGTEHLFRRRLRKQHAAWSELTKLAPTVSARRADWREVMRALGYELEKQRYRGYLARFNGRPVCVVHPKRLPDEFARLDERGAPPEGVLINDCEALNAPFGLLAAGSRMRLFEVEPTVGSAVGRYLDIDAAVLEDDDLPLLGLLSPAYLADGRFKTLLNDARDFGADLRERLDRAIRTDVLPVLGREFGRWAEAEGLDTSDDATLSDLEAASLTFVFRTLFLLYAESSQYLPVSYTIYHENSLTRTVEIAHDTEGRLDRRGTGLWDRVHLLTKAMRTGNTAWRVPGYNGELFAADGFAGAKTLERASIADAALGPALVALGRDASDSSVGVDFSGLEIGHLGHIYEGLLSLRLRQADRDFRYDARSDRYRPCDPSEADVRSGELLWITDEGGRKGGGVYYTREELVRHLVRRGVLPAFERHLERVAATAERAPAEAGDQLFDFKVIDPACGSAHFLVAVIDELADRTAKFLGQTPLPALREKLERLQCAARPTPGAPVEDAALLRRLILKHCVFGVDISPMGAEIAKLSLWLASFVPGLSLLYLGRNVHVGDSLIGVSRPEVVREAPAGGKKSAKARTAAPTGETLFDDEILVAMGEAAKAATRLADMEDRTPDEYHLSEQAAAEMKAKVSNAWRYFNLWCAEPLGLDGARKEFFTRREPLLAGDASLLTDQAGEFAKRYRFLHWPLAFPEVFVRENPGFDAIVGNPPWEKVKVEEHEFFARYRTGLRGLPEAERRSELEQLKASRPELVDRHDVERRRTAAMRKFFGPAGGYVGSAGDRDVYKLFCQRYRDLLRRGGKLAVVLPGNTFTSDGTKGFRRWLFGETRVERLDFLVNRRGWMFDIHQQWGVALVVTELGPASDEVEVAGVAATPVEFSLQSKSPGVMLTIESLGEHHEVPRVANQADADLLAKLRVGTQTFAFGAGRWRCFPVREFDETNDRELWEGATDGWRLWKGESFDQFDPRGFSERRCPPDTAMPRAMKKRPGTDSRLASEIAVAERADAVRRELSEERVAFRDVTRAVDSRTVRACLVPRETFLTHSASYLAFTEGPATHKTCCLGLMNSIAFDWQARRFVDKHLSFFVVEMLRLPEIDIAAFGAIATAAARLSCLDDRFKDFAADVGVECGPLPDAEYTRLRVEIDAQVARAWSLTEADMAVIFSDFTESAVTPDYRRAVLRRMRELD